MRVVFAGTPEFAAAALEAILAAGFDVPLVLTQPDRPAGRGMKLQASAVKQVAQAAGLKVFQPRGLRLDGRWSEDARSTQAALAATHADVMVVAAYGLILPNWVLSFPRLGCLNIHASLLPRWRGAAPIHRAVEAGDAESGITIMQMDEGLDTGPMLLMESVALHPKETTASLHDRLAGLGAAMITRALALADRGELQPTIQPEHGVTYAHKIMKTEAPIDWTLPADVIERRIRAFNPFPGATFSDGEAVIKVWDAQAVMGPEGADSQTSQPAPGTLVGPALRTQAGTHGREEEPVLVACGQGLLKLIVLQRPSGNRQPAQAVAQSLKWHVGHRLGH